MIAVAVPAAILPAIFALIFALCWAQWGTVITQTMNFDLPVIGNVIGNAVATVFNGAYALIIYFLDGLITPVAQLILGPIAAVENGFASLQSALPNVYNTLYGIITVRGPQWVQDALGPSFQFIQTVFNQAMAGIADVRSYAATGFADLTSYTVNAVTSLTSTISNDIAAIDSYTVNAVGVLEHDVAASLVAATAYADEGVRQAEDFTRSAFTSATGYATSLATQLSNDIAATLNAAEGYAQTTATAAVGVLTTDIDQSITASLAGIWTDVDKAVTDVIGVIGTGDAAVRDALGRIDWSIPANVAAVASLAGVTSLTLMRYLRDCGVPNCQNLSTFGQELQSVIGLVDGGLLIAFLVELIHSPTQAAGLFADTVGDVISDGLSIGKELIG